MRFPRLALLSAAGSLLAAGCAARAPLAEIESLLDRRREALAAARSARDRIVGASGARETLKREREVARLEREVEEAFFSALEALARAGRGAPVERRRGFARLYLERWREAVAAGDEVSRALFEERVRAFDPEGEHRDEIEGRGTISIESAPEGARAYLFRYEEQAGLESGGEFRLVPVPFDPAGGARTVFGAGLLRAGNPALVIEAVGRGTSAEAAGIEPGDLVVRVAGHPIEGAVLVARVDPAGPTAAAGAAPLDRLVRIGDRAVSDRFEVARAFEAAAKGTDVDVVFARGGEVVAASVPVVRGDPGDLGCALATPAEILERGADEGELAVTTLSGGVPRESRIAAREGSHLRLSPTASPLVFCGGNFLGTTPLGPVSAPPGSYLVVLRREGREDLRLPLRLDRGGRAEVRGEMRGVGDGPGGFVFVAGGPYVAGGDPEAVRGFEGGVREVPDFWISRRETTVEEWIEFLNDPRTLREIEEEFSRTGTAIRVPRDFATPEGHWPRGEDGRFDATWDPRAPLVAVTWEDAIAFARWRTARAAERGESWVFELPREEEWEKAARGVDGRKFPWGNDFDPAFCKGGASRPGVARLEPVGTFFRDESPYGVLDLAGGASEWCAEWLTEGVTRVLRGGSFEVSSPGFFRAAYRNGSYPDVLLTQPGIRLVARPAGEGGGG